MLLSSCFYHFDTGNCWYFQEINTVPSYSPYLLFYSLYGLYAYFPILVVASPRMSAIRVPTIIGQPVVSTLPFALSVYPSSSSPASTSPRRRPHSRQCSPGDTPSSPSPTREHKTAVPGLSPPTNSPIHSRISNFSISELSKSDKVVPPQTQQQPLAPTCTAAFFHPGTGMLLLPQLASGHHDSCRISRRHSRER